VCHLGGEVVGPGLDERVDVWREGVAGQPDDRRCHAHRPNLPRRLRARTHARRRRRAERESQLSAQQLNAKAHALQLAGQSTNVNRRLGFRAHAYGMPHLVAVHDGHLPVGDDEVVGGGGAAIPHAPHQNLRQPASQPAHKQALHCTLGEFERIYRNIELARGTRRVDAHCAARTYPVDFLVLDEEDPDHLALRRRASHWRTDARRLDQTRAQRPGPIKCAMRWHRGS
jgi:hypothetical protein